MMQGITAYHFATATCHAKPGDTAVVHAAAGGVGILLTQIIKAMGGTVTGLVSREEKTGVVREAGAGHVLVRSGGGFEGPRTGRGAVTPRPQRERPHTCASGTERSGLLSPNRHRLDR